nr:PREDICTED: SH3-containing GRB2-like protein 3-interacting protein 1 [Struthio camelus australis]
MPNLMAHLKKVSEQKPQATYYNVDMLKYQVSAQGIQSTPLNLAVSWRCEPASTDLRIDYKYNTEAMTTPVALNNVQFLVPVDGGVTKLQAVLPPAVWYETRPPARGALVPKAPCARRAAARPCLSLGKYLADN